MNIYKVLKDCEEVTGSNAKKQVLADAAKNDKTEQVDELKYVLKNALDPFIIFGVKKFEFDEECEHEQDFQYNWSYAKLLLNNLQSKRITGNAALQQIKKTSKNLNKEQQAVLFKILKKDLDCGLGVKSVNKVFPKLIRQFDVQLAQPAKHGKIEFPCLVEQKLDGIRCIAFVVNGNVSYYSRNGKELENFDGFSSDLLILADGKNRVFDGEVIGASLEESFEGVTTQFKRKKNVQADNLKYYLFDVLSHDEFLKQTCTMTQSHRTELLTDLFKTYLDNEKAQFKIRCVDGVVASSEKAMTRFYEKCVASGYEGVIVKNVDAMYTYKRDACWTKIKPVETLDLEIVGIKKGKKKYAGMLGAFIVDHNGVNVDVGSGYTDEQRKKFNTKNMIGKMVEVRYDCVTPDGSLRFPRFKTLRPDKD